MARPVIALAAVVVALLVASGCASGGVADGGASAGTDGLEAWFLDSGETPEVAACYARSLPGYSPADLTALATGDPAAPPRLADDIAAAQTDCLDL